jgi:hypothetical protein
MPNLCVVQFMHPGGEHVPDLADGRTWNHGVHQRTFLRCHGSYVASTGQLVNDDLEFWGEWEPPVRILNRNPAPDNGFPRFVCEPQVELPIGFNGQQNTDPFVFGDRFLYGICQQHTRFGPTSMQTLDRGSLILFGSHKYGEFHLDTVFVVDRAAPHSADNFRATLPEWAPPLYRDVVLAPWYDSLGTNPGSKGSGRLYGGATFADPVHGMFSFFPCLPATPTFLGFARPVVRLPDRITDTLTQRRRVTPLEDLDDARTVWDVVVDQVRRQNLLLGTLIDLPHAR